MIDNRSQYESALRQGHSFSWDQRWPEAIEEFQRAIEATDHEPAPFAGLGMAYAELGDLDRALDNYKIAARLSKGDMIYLRQVAEVQERLGQSAEAGQTYMAIGELQLKRRRLDEAVGNWLQAARLAPESLGAHRRLAAVYKRQGLTRNAVREYLAIARIHASREHKEEALKACQSALELDPRSVETLTLLNLIQHGGDVGSVDVEDQATAGESVAGGFPETESGQELKHTSRRSNGRQAEEIGESGLLGEGRSQAQSQLAQQIFGDEDPADAAMSPSEGDENPGVIALISQALDYQTRDMTDDAIASYEHALAQGVSGAAIHFCLGILYHGKMRYGQAKREFEQSMTDKSLRPASYYAIGEAYRTRGNLRRAIEYYVAALRAIDLSYLAPQRAERVKEMYTHLVNDLLSTEEPGAALEFVASLTEFLGRDGWQQRVERARSRLDRLSVDGQPLILGEILTAGSLQVLESLHLSQEYAEQNKFDSAVEEAYRAIQLSPFYLAGHIQLAELMAKQDRLEIAIGKYQTIGDTCRVRGDIGGALANYERAVELAPMDLTNRSGLIDLLIEQGLIDRALEHYQTMGEAFYNLAEVDKARETYLEALKLAPRGSAELEWRPRFIQAIADIDIQRLDWKRALAAYNELSTSKPDDERIEMTLIDLYYKVDQSDMAIRHLDRFLIRLVRSGKGIRVFAVLEELMELRPTDADIADRLSRLYLRQGRTEEALELLDGLGEAQLNAGESQAAIKTIERILALDPPNADSYQQILQQLLQADELNKPKSG